MKTRAGFSGLLLALMHTMPVSAQFAAFVPELPATPVDAPPSAMESFGIEAAGGLAGSLAGFGLIYLVDRECDVEDTTCNLETAGLALAAGTAGAATGAYLAGRTFDTNPSGLGVAVGAVAGAAAGVGVWHLLTEELNLIDGVVPVVLSYTITQGIVTALGSRLVRSVE